MKISPLLILLVSFFSTALYSGERRASDTMVLNNLKHGVIKKGKEASAYELLLLSGPTDNWHSDLDWWILSQNYLSQEYSTIALARAGQVGSQKNEQLSYSHFAQQLESFVQKTSKPQVIIAFASSNLSVRLALENSRVQKKVKGIILIDPDVLTPHSIEHYTLESEGFKKNWQPLEDYITAGKYQERIKEKIASERKHVTEVIPKQFIEYMDWDIYGRYETLKVSPAYQLNKFKEITEYRSDLEKAMKVDLPQSIPLVIIDSDFETGYLKTIKEQKAKQSIIKWRDEGKEQFFYLAKENKCGAYWPITSQEHLVTFTQPDLIKRAVERIEFCNQ